MIEKVKPRQKKPRIKKSGAKIEKIDRNAPKEERFKERWNALNSDVHTALSHWNDLTVKYSGKLSREDQQLQEIKSLLKDLQNKLKVFND